MPANSNVSSLSPAKRAIVIGMDGASMELVNNVIDWGHAPNMGKLRDQGVFRPYDRRFSDPDATGVDRVEYWFVARHPPSHGF